MNIGGGITSEHNWIVERDVGKKRGSYNGKEEIC